MDICIFGDSITHGMYDRQKGGWVHRLRLHLNAKNYNGDLYNLGICGNTSTDLLKRLSIEIQNRKSNMIIIAIGINDSRFVTKSRKNTTSEEKFKKNIHELINQAKKYSDKIIFIGLTPVDRIKVSSHWADNKFKYTNRSVYKYNMIIKNTCLKQNIKFLNLFNNFIKMPYKDYLYDGLHPNDKGHNWIFQQVIKNIFNNKSSC